MSSGTHFNVTRVRSEWPTHFLPGHLIIDSRGRRLVFQPRWFFRTLLRRPVFVYPFDVIRKVTRSDCSVNMILVRSEAKPAISVQVRNREVRFVPRPSRFDDAFMAVKRAVGGGSVAAAVPVTTRPPPIRAILFFSYLGAIGVLIVVGTFQGGHGHFPRWDEWALFLTCTIPVLGSVAAKVVKQMRFAMWRSDEAD
jgi:hypothetical protein